MADTPMVQQSTSLPFAFCGRSFLATEIELLRDVVSDFRSLSLTEITRTICELLEWKRPNGRLKNHECRLLLEKLSAAGLVRLPALRESGPRGPRVVLPTEHGAEQEPVSGSVLELGPLSLTVVRSGHESALWNELVDLPLSRIPSSGRSQFEIPGAFRLGKASVGVPVVVQSGLEDGGARSLDWLDR